MPYYYYFLETLRVKKTQIIGDDSLTLFYWQTNIGSLSQRSIQEDKA